MFLALALFAVSGMTVVPTGSYQPLYGPAKVRVASFSLDKRTVTRGEFLEFAAAHPEWRTPTLITTYLARPVTDISRLAAEAFCAAHGKRLPTVDEWEYAATLGLVGKRGDPWEWTAAEHHHGMHASHDASCAGAAIGAADPTNYIAFQRFAIRAALDDTSTMRALGFRCAS